MRFSLLAELPVLILIALIGLLSMSSTARAQEASVSYGGVSALRPLGSEVLERAASAFNTKCLGGFAAWPCWLNETDVDPNGRSGRILVFRGENEIFAAPASSSFYRWLSTTGDCAAECAPTELNQNFYRMLGAEKLAVVASSHMAGHTLSIEGVSANFDPFVSFSFDPKAARRFGGEVIIASVPESKFSRVACDKPIIEVDRLYDIHACAEVDLQLEQEIDFLYFLPTSYVYGLVSDSRK